MLWLSRSQDRTKTSQNQAISNNTLINCSFKSQISSVQHSKFLFNYGIILFETWRSKFNGIDGITQIRWDKLHCDRIPTTSRQLYVLIWLHFIVWCWPLFRYSSHPCPSKPGIYPFCSLCSWKSSKSINRHPKLREHEVKE